LLSSRYYYAFIPLQTSDASESSKTKKPKKTKAVRNGRVQKSRPKRKSALTGKKSRSRVRKEKKTLALDSLDLLHAHTVLSTSKQGTSSSVVIIDETSPEIQKLPDLKKN
jgi:hypothetical protein